MENAVHARPESRLLKTMGGAIFSFSHFLTYVESLDYPEIVYMDHRDARMVWESVPLEEPPEVISGGFDIETFAGKVRVVAVYIPSRRKYVDISASADAEDR